MGLTWSRSEWNGEVEDLQRAGGQGSLQEEEEKEWCLLQSLVSAGEAAASGVWSGPAGSG